MFSPDKPVFDSLIAAAILLLSAFGAGSVFRLKNNFVTFSAGLALIAFAGWLFPVTDGWSLAALTVLLCATAVYGAVKLFPAVKNSPYIFLAGAALWLAAAGSSFLPPYSWDECVYQTALLKHYVGNGNYNVLSDNPFSAFPSLPHSIMKLGYEAVLWKGNLYLPRILSSAITAITLAALLKIIRKSGGRPALLFFFAALLSPVTLVLARANYVEQYILLFFTAGVLSILKLRHYPVKCACFAALFAAASFCVKLTGAGAALALAVLYIITVPQKRFLLQCGAASGVFLIFCTPFFLRPLLASGNPFYPFAAELFTSDLSQIEVSRYHHLLGSYRYGLGALSGIALGWLFSAFDAQLFDGITVNWQFPAMMIFCIAGTILLFHQSSRRFKISGAFLATGAVLYIFWALTSQQTRFLLPLLWLAAVLCGFTAKALNGKKRVFLAAAILCCGFIQFPIDHLKHFVTAWRIQKFVHQDPGRFLAAASRDPGYFEMVKFFETTPENSRVLFLLNERRTLYMPRKTTIGEPFFQPLNTPVPQNANELWKNIKNFDYIVTSSSGHNPDIQKSILPEFLKVASMLNTLREEGKIQQVFSDSRAEYLIFRCGETATGTEL